MVYEYPTQNITGLVSYFKYINAISYGLFGYFILFASFLIMFIALKYFRTEEAFVSASFFTIVIAILLNIMGLVGFDAVLWPIVAIIVSIFVQKK